MLSIKLKLKLKSGDIKRVMFDEVTNLYIDYEKNKLSLYDYGEGVDFSYHFNPIGNERGSEATEILDIQITKREEE